MSLIIIQGFTLPSQNLPEGDYTWRLFYNAGFLDSSGQAVAPGTATSGTQIRGDVTVSGGLINFDPVGVYSTLDAQTGAPQSIQIGSQLFRGNSAVNVFPFNQITTPPMWIVPSDLGATLSFEDWTIANQRIQLTNPPQTFYTAPEVDALIEAAVDQAALNQDYVIGSYASLSAAVTAITVTGGTLVINQATSSTTNLTVPSNITLRFTRKGSITVSTGTTLTIAGPIEADLAKIFYNATAGQGVVILNNLVPELYTLWWGAVVDGVTDDRSAIVATCASAVTSGIYKVRQIGNSRVSAGITLDNRMSFYGGPNENSQNLDGLTANGSLGFSGNFLIKVDQPLGSYLNISNLTLNTFNINNSSYIPLDATGLSETSVISTLQFYVENSTISRLFYFNTFGPLTLENINVVPGGTNSVVNEPIWINAPAGLLFSNLNYNMGTAAAKGLYISTGVFGTLSGLQVETHPTSASEPSMTLAPSYGISLRDSRFNTIVASSSMIKLMMPAQPDLAGCNLENIGLDTGGAGTWDKIITLEDAAGNKRYWQRSNLLTASSAQLPPRIIRFTPSEQIFNGIDSNYGPRNFRDTWMFDNVAGTVPGPAGTITIPFNPRVYIGSLGTANVLISVSGRVTIAGTNNAALIFLDYADLAGGGVVPTFNWIVGTSGANWGAAYSSGTIVLTNRNTNACPQVIVHLSHSSFNLFPTP